MTISPTLRWMLLLTVAVSVFEFFQGDAPAPTGSAANSNAAAKPTRATPLGQTTDRAVLADIDGPLHLPKPRDSDWPRQKLASNYGWEPAAPPPPVATKPVVVVAPPPPPEPQGPAPAPPFPYQMVGLLEQDGSTSAWLTGSGGTRTVTAEQVLDGRWRVGTISARGMSVTWLETGQNLQIKYAP